MPTKGVSQGTNGTCIDVEIVISQAFCGLAPTAQPPGNQQEDS